MKQPEPDWYVMSLDRGLAVLRCFDADNPALKASDIAKRCGLSRAAARRFLLTLERIGYVSERDGRYALRLAVLELGSALLSSTNLDRLLQPELEALSARVGETCSIGVLNRDEVLVIARAQTQRLVRTQIGVGSRLPLYATSLGKVLLAFQPDDAMATLLDQLAFKRYTAATIIDAASLRLSLSMVRGRGYAVAADELEDGIASISMPIHDRAGQVVAAVNVSSFSSRVGDPMAADALRAALREAAGRLGLAVSANPALGAQLSPAPR